MCRDIIDIGTRLIAVKGKVGHGKWLAWLDAEFGWSDRTARSFMSVADRFGGLKSETVSDLHIDATALYLLSKDSIPQELRDAAVARAEAGEVSSRRCSPISAAPAPRARR